MELLSGKDGQRQRSSAKTYQEKKTEQILVTDKEGHGGHQLSVTAAEHAAPEEQKRNREDRDPRLEGVTGRD